MTISLRRPPRALNQSRRIGMTRMDHVIHFFSRRSFTIGRINFTHKQLLVTLVIILIGCLAGIASYFWSVRSAPTPYTWGTYTSCPSSWITTSDPSWESDPLVHTKGGIKTTSFTQAEHMVACSIPLVRNEKERNRFLRNGLLTELVGEHLLLVDVEEPYVTPLMDMFVNRLSKQYVTEAKCGKLVVTSALRNLARQRREIKNGPLHSVHPFGMSVDLRIPIDSRCRIWLRDALLGAELGGRVDFTIETFPAHYHVVLVPGAYETWLMQELGIKAELGYNVEEVHWLATALYFEGAVNEKKAGLQAIASVIKNRRDGKRFSADTVEEVVKQGANGQKNGGCHFSFMCDGLPEQPGVICEQHPKDTKKLSGGKSYFCGRRWAAYHRYAVEFMTAPDNTGGADHYYTGKKPWWADKEMKQPKEIGSHIFG